jgi:nucleoside-diphosphate-sugar epimerase
MKILVTGGTGFLGSHLVRALVHRGDRVVVLTRPGSDWRRLASVAREIVRHELSGDLERAFAAHGPIEAVIHTATCYGRRGETDVEIFAANTALPMRLLDAASRYGVATFYNTDTSLDRTVNAYALSKKQFAEWGRHVANSGRIRFVNIVLEHVYGPDDDETKFTARLIKQFLAGAPVVELTAGEQRRDFVYVDDVVAAYLLLLESTRFGRAGAPEVAVGSGRPIALRDFVEAARRATGATTDVRFGAVPYREHEVMCSQADVGPLNALGWGPRVELADGIQRIVEWEQRA